MRFAFIRDHQAEFPVEVLCEVLEGLAQRLLRLDATAAEPRRPAPRPARRGDPRGPPREPRHLRLAARPPGAEGPRRPVLREHRGQADEGRGSALQGPATVRGQDHRQPTRPPRGRETSWTASSTPIVPTRSGRPTSPTSRRPRAGSTWRWCSTCSRGGWWAGRRPTTCEPSWPATRCGWPWGIAGPKGELLHHSDRGVQYASEAYQHLLAEHGIEPSMSRTGNCCDNAVTESFFSTVKRELTHHESYASREEARRSLFEYIEVFYNRQRLHSTLGYRSPVEYEVRFAS